MASFSSAAGNETITGGAGGADTLNLTGAARDARFSLDAQGRWVVTSVAGGADTLASIENLAFADGVIGVSTPAPRVVSDLGVAYQSQTLIGVQALADGGYMVAYITANDEAAPQITLRSIDANGFATSTRLGFTGGISDPQLVLLEDGRSAIVFRNSAGVQLAIDQGNPVTIAAAATGVSYGAPDIAALAGGGSVVAYSQYSTSTGYQVHARLQGVSGAAGPIVLAGNGTPPSVTGLADGGFALTWADNTGKLFLRTYSATGAPEGAAVQVAGSVNASYATSVTELADGGMVVTWHEGPTIKAQRFDASGAAEGAALTVIPEGDGDHSVTALADGSYVVVVVSYGQLVVQRVPSDGSALPLPYTAYLNVDGAPAVSVDATTDGGFVVGWTELASNYYEETATMRFGADGSPALPTLVGTDAGDRIVTSGTGDRRLEGGAGHDLLSSGSGKDWLDGGEGDDTLQGGLGDDTYYISGADVLVDTGGSDTAIGSTSFTLQLNIENGRLTGATNADLLGNAAANSLAGNGGANVLDGGSGADTMMGGGGDDTYVVDQAGDFILERAGEGLDTVVSSVSHVLAAGLENLHLSGHAIVDGTGNTEDNVLVGNTQANVLDGREGEDTLVGGLGNDVYVVTQLDTVVEDADGGIDTVRSGASWVLEEDVERLELTGSAAANGTGNDLANTLTGNTGNNILDGGAGADTMAGGEGSDTYVVDHEGDFAEDAGAGGVDQVRSTATFRLSSGLENLTLLGNAAIDGTGNASNNVLRGNAGANRLNGSYGSDLVYGYGGNDFLDGNDASGVDTLVGGLGNDTYYIGASDAVELREAAGQGNDTVLVAAEAGEGYTLGANLENLQLSGFDVYGIGNELANRITGTDGANRLNGGAGADVLEGKQGNDTYIVDAAGDRIIEAVGGGVDEVIASASHVLGANVEHGMLAGSGSLQLTGQALNNRLLGNAGANTLRGEGGNDVLNGAGGNDSLYGGDGNDRINGVLGNDRLDGGTGTDTADYSTAAGGITLNLGLATAQATGGGGTDTLVGVENAFGSQVAGDKLTGTTGANLLRGLGGNDTLAGAGGNDRLFGDDGDDELVDGAGDSVLNGGAGFDTLSYFSVAGKVSVTLERTDAQATGAAGSDVILNVEALVGSNTGSDFLGGDFEDNLLRGEGGNDTLAGGDGNDTLQGGSGIDVADYSGSVFEVRVSLAASGAQDTEGAGVDTLVDIEGLKGSDWGNDHLTGNGAANRLDGGGGSDTLVGGLGDDVYVVDAAGDRVVEAASAGLDTVESSITVVLGANLENLVLTGTAAAGGTGTAAANLLVGNTGANALNGGAGNDTLAGGRGNDVLTGGTGADAFRFDVASGGVDTIADFVAADDRIELDNAVFTALGAATGTLGAAAFVVGAAAADTSDRIVYNSANGSLYYDADGSGAGAAVLVARITGAPALTVADFVVI